MIRLVVQRPVFSEMRNPGGPPVAYEYLVIPLAETMDVGGHCATKVELSPDDHVIWVLP